MPPKTRKKAFTWTETLVAQLCELRLEHKAEFQKTKKTAAGFRIILDEMLRLNPELELDTAQLQTKWKSLRESVTKYNDTMRTSGAEGVDLEKPPHYSVIVAAIGEANPVVSGPEVQVVSSRPVATSVAEEVNQRVNKEVDGDTNALGVSAVDGNTTRDNGQRTLKETGGNTTEDNGHRTLKETGGNTTRNKEERTSKEMSARKRRKVEQSLTLTEMKEGAEKRGARMQEIMKTSVQQDREKINIMSSMTTTFNQYVQLMMVQALASNPSIQHLFPLSGPAQGTTAAPSGPAQGYNVPQYGAFQGDTATPSGPAQGYNDPQYGAFQGTTATPSGPAQGYNVPQYGAFQGDTATPSGPAQGYNVPQYGAFQGDTAPPSGPAKGCNVPQGKNVLFMQDSPGQSTVAMTHVRTPLHSIENRDRWAVDPSATRSRPHMQPPPVFKFQNDTDEDTDGADSLSAEDDGYSETESLK